MVKEIEKAGIPIVQIANLIPVAKSVGTNKMVEAVSIPYPLGKPTLSEDDQRKLRYRKVGAALDALTVDIEEQTVFSS